MRLKDQAGPTSPSVYMHHLYNHNMASGMPSLPLRYNCVGISHLWILETVSGFDIVNGPVNASNGSNKRVWLSFSFLISSSNALLVSIPVSYYCY